MTCMNSMKICQQSLIIFPKILYQLHEGIYCLRFVSKELFQLHPLDVEKSGIIQLINWFP